MVTAAKGAESFYMYATEDNIKSESKSDEESDNSGSGANKVRR